MEGHELRRLRTAHGLSQVRLAEMIEVSPEAIALWEATPAGEDAGPIGPETRRLILRALAVWRETQKRRAWLIPLLSGAETTTDGVRAVAAAGLPPPPATSQAFAVKVR